MKPILQRLTQLEFTVIAPDSKISKAQNPILPEWFTSQFANYKHPQKLDVKKWPMPTLTFTPGSKPNAAVEKIWHRKKQPIPLPKGELDMFATTPFKPDCCPNTYSNSMGCACMTVDQYSYLRHRAGNNVPYSEY